MLSKKVEKNKENETSETRYFVERDRNWREMAKKKMKQTDFTGKKDYKKGKQGDTQKEKRGKNEKEQKEVKEEWAKKNDEKEEDKWWKKQKNKGGQNKRLESKKGSHKKWSRSEKMTEAIFERCTKKINF